MQSRQQRPEPGAVRADQFGCWSTPSRTTPSSCSTPTASWSSWNAGAERIKGYKAEEILGQHFSRFYEPDDIAAGLARMLARAAREGRTQGQGWRVREDEGRFYAQVTLTALFDSEASSSATPRSPRTFDRRAGGRAGPPRSAVPAGRGPGHRPSWAASGGPWPATR